MLAAMNEHVQCKLEPLGVEIFSVSFDATNIHNDDTVCGHHYLCKIDAKSKNVYGRVGGRVLEALLYNICGRKNN